MNDWIIVVITIIVATNIIVSESARPVTITNFQVNRQNYRSYNCCSNSYRHSYSNSAWKRDKFLGRLARYQAAVDSNTYSDRNRYSNSDRNSSCSNSSCSNSSYSNSSCSNSSYRSNTSDTVCNSYGNHTSSVMSPTNPLQMIYDNLKKVSDMATAALDPHNCDEIVDSLPLMNSVSLAHLALEEHMLHAEEDAQCMNIVETDSFDIAVFVIPKVTVTNTVTIH